MSKGRVIIDRGEPYMSDEDVMRELRSDSPLNRLRKLIYAEIARAEQDAAQRRPPGPVEVRRREFAAAKRIAAALGVKL